MNRRRFLLASAAATAAATWARMPALAAAAPTRAAAYRAFVSSLRATGDPRFRRAEPAVAYRRFAAWYRAQPAAARAHADAILAAAELRGPRAVAPRSRPDARARFAAALSLACVGCEPPLAEDERPDLPTLGPT